MIPRKPRGVCRRAPSAFRIRMTASAAYLRKIHKYRLNIRVKSGIMEETNAKGRFVLRYATHRKDMTMICKYLICIFSVICLLLSLPSCQKEPSYEDRETFPQETYVPVAGGGVILYDGLTVAEVASNSNVREWLNACSGSDRNDYFGGYVLRHEITEGENTVFTYLVYYPHGNGTMALTPELLEGSSGYVLNLHYEQGVGVTGYSVSHLTVTVPTDKAPRVRILVGDQAPGVLVSVSSVSIPVPNSRTSEG